jgi:hypothetical protein
MRTSLAILCLLPALASATEPVEQAEKLFQDMEYDRARKIARSVLSSPGASPEVLVTAYRIQGLCLSAMGKPGKAVRAFRRLLAIEPEFRISPDISPKLAAPFFQAVAMSRGDKGILLRHNPPEPKMVLGGLLLKVRLAADPLRMIRTVRMRFLTDQDKKERRMTAAVRKPGLLGMRLPKGLKAREIHYFFEALNEHGGVVKRLGGKKKPFKLRVQLKPGSTPEALVLAPFEEEPPPPPPPVVTDLAKATAPVTPPPEDDDGATPWYETWWFWTAVGVVAVGATTGAILATQAGDESGPVDYGIRVE